MTHFVFNRAVGILISPPVGAPGAVNNGSGFLLRLADGDYLGTAWHVVDRWVQRTAAGEQVTFQAGRLALNPHDRLGWRDERNDIAFLRLGSGEANRAGIDFCEPLLGWPPPHPTEGAYMLISGFPGAERTRPAADEIDFSAFSALLQITTVHDRYVVCQFAREHWIVDGARVPEPGVDLGGISGGPALFVKNLAYPLTGLITEFSSDFELLYIKTLSHAPVSLD